MHRAPEELALWPLQNLHSDILYKGAPARESRTGPRLVSPATGCKKKKDTSGAGPRNTKLSTLEIILASTDAMETGTASGKPLKPESG